MTVLFRCPFCGRVPVWVEKESMRSAEGETPMRALVCANDQCSIRPQTRWRPTTEWKQGIGHYDVSFDKIAVAEWNGRVE